MILKSEDFALCQKPEKEIVAGLCLSYDLLRGICMETDDPCIILQQENSPGSDPDLKPES